MDLEKLVDKQELIVTEEDVVIENTKEVNLDKEIREYVKGLKEKKEKEKPIEIEKQIVAENNPPIDKSMEQYLDNIIELSFELEVEDY